MQAIDIATNSKVEAEFITKEEYFEPMSKSDAEAIERSHESIGQPLPDKGYKIYEPFEKNIGDITGSISFVSEEVFNKNYKIVG